MDSRFLERYRAEATDVLDAILNHSRDCIKLLTIEGKIEFASASAADALALTTAEEAIGKSWPEFWPLDARPRVYDAIEAAAKGVSVRFDGATPDSDGGARHWEVTISPVRGEGGGITHLLAVSTDVTAQFEAAEQSRMRWERAEAQIGRADDVMGELRHRMKNQLAVVAAVTKLLARHSGSARELARKLEEKLIALSRAQDLVTLSRDEPVNAREAVMQVLHASVAGERIDIERMPEVELPDEAIQQLALILGELQTNALKHGALSDEGGRVRLSGRSQSGVLTLVWEEDCAKPTATPGPAGGGFHLIERLGAAGGHRSLVKWRENGIRVEFHVRAPA